MNTNYKFTNIKSKFENYHQQAVKRLRDKHTKALSVTKENAVSVFGGAMLASSIVTMGASSISATPNAVSSILTTEKAKTKEKNNVKEIQLISQTRDTLIAEPANINSLEELKAQKALSDYYNLDLRVTLDGNRMNQSWGYFGQEQHLYRWKGDLLEAHDEYQEHGMAPATGAFGYFDNAEQEKYYIAAPIHLIPTWNTDWPDLKPWYKFRKVLVYNPKTNKAVVAVVGDAGPAEWTGKDFGGSPEVMHHLGMVDGRAKSKAIVLFIDESNGEVPLGPIDHKEVKLIASK